MLTELIDPTHQLVLEDYKIMLSQEERELLVSIAYGNISVDEADKEKLVNAIKEIVKENDELQKIRRNDAGEEVIQDDQAVEDEEVYLD